MSNRPPRNPDIRKLPKVPEDFIRIFRGTLAKMAGEKIIPYDFVNLDFWNAFPRKFNTKKNYQTSKVILIFLKFKYSSLTLLLRSLKM